jgi:WD40 repeat protein
VKILKVKKSKIEFVRALVKAEDQCLSVELDTLSASNEKTIVKTLFAGYSDSSIRKWDIQTGNSILHFQKLTKKALKKTGTCLIWKLKLFKGFLLCGDSMGDIVVWDSEFGTLVKQFNNLKGDINSIEVNEQY